MNSNLALTNTCCRFVLVWITIFLFIGVCQSQNAKGSQFEVTGTVLQKGSQIPLEFATVIIELPGSKQVYGGIVDSKGRFKISVPGGVCNLRIEFFSFETIRDDGIEIMADTDLPPYLMQESSQQLDEVEVIAERSSMEVKLDRKVYNVGADLTVKGATASDVLDNVPSVTVDADGVVSLRGNENVRIFVNGKPSGLIGINDTEALRQFPADAIKKVEVITSPSARYDAEGTAGILNIILRRDRANGFNGIATASLGIPEAYGFSTSLNYRLKKINFFTNLGYSNRNSPGNANTQTQYFSEDASYTFTDEQREYNRQRENWNFNIGMEYFISDFTSITGSVLFRNSDRNQIAENVTEAFSEELILENTQLRIEDEASVDKVNEYNINFLHRFNDEGHELNFDGQYQDNSDIENTLITNQETFPQDLELPSEKIDAEENQEKILLQADYVLPFRKDQQFEFGARYTQVDQITDYVFYNEDQNGDFIINDSLTNLFTYNEKISALYAQYGNKFKNGLSVLLGLRTETTDIDIRAEGKEIDSINNKYYTNYFPTANLVYEFNEDENITLGYNSRIRRPRSRFINPFPSQSSRTNIFQGNPDLDPSISNGLDLGYYKRWQKFGLSTSAYFSHATNVFQFISEDTGQSTEDGIPIIRRTPINIGTDDRYGMEFSLVYTPIRSWRFQTSFNFYNSNRNGEYEGQDLSFRNTSWFGQFSSKIVLPAKIDWQTTLFYRGPREDAQNKRKGVATLNLAFSKDLLKNNATLALNVSDLFNSRKRIQETTGETFYQESEFQYRERQWRLTFVYRFNQKKKRERSRESFGGDGEGEFGS